MSLIPILSIAETYLQALSKPAYAAPGLAFSV